MRDCNRASSIRTSPTPVSSSVADTARAHPLGLDDAGNGDDRVTAHDERPALSVGARDLGVHEDILHLSVPTGEPVARLPATDLEPWQRGLDPPDPPLHRPAELDRPA